MAPRREPRNEDEHHKECKQHELNIEAMLRENMATILGKDGGKPKSASRAIKKHSLACAVTCEDTKAEISRTCASVCKELGIDKETRIKTEGRGIKR